MQGLRFDAIPVFLGKSGCNVKDIVKASGAKIRVRGRGSGHLEHGGKKEARTPLMVAVSATAGNPAGFRLAVDMTLQILLEIEVRYKTYCGKRGWSQLGPCWTFSVFEAQTKKLLDSLV